jgi:hypothetical protein
VPVVGKLHSTPTARRNLSMVRRLSAMLSSRFIATNSATLIITHATFVALGLRVAAAGTRDRVARGEPDDALLGHRLTFG